MSEYFQYLLGHNNLDFINESIFTDVKHYITFDNRL